MSALALRIIASISMLLDHIGFCLHIDVLRYIGRLAFPLYVFLMVNGFYHTKDRTRYALRLALFAVLSQIPFTLMCYNKAMDPRLNVMVTLLLGLLVIWLGEAMRKHRYLRYICLVPAIVVYGACYFGWIQSDYDTKGILLAVVFWYFRDKKLWITIGAFFAVWSSSIVSFGFDLLYGRQTPVPTAWQMTQMLSLLALPLIFLYNGQPGRLPKNPMGKKAVQFAFYSFYPIHMLLLWFFFKR